MPFKHPDSWEKFPTWHIVEMRREFNPAIHGHSNITIGGAGTPKYITSSSVRIRLGSGEWLPVNGKSLGFSLSTEVITGWRAWDIVDFDRRGGVSEKRLRAVGVPHIWEPYTANVATCHSGGANHEAPWPTCHCGFWAFKERSYVERAMREKYGGEPGKVFGILALWGRVLECQNGFRGEYAYPQTFQFVETTKETAEEVSNIYGVPYSIVERSEQPDCPGFISQTEYDFDRFYATIEYACGLKVRAEISRLWDGGKRTLNFDNVPPCPHHS